MQPNFFEHLEALLKTNKAYVAEDGRLLRNKVAEAAATLDPGLLRLLLSDAEAKKRFFADVDGTAVFDKTAFGWVVENRAFLPDSFTRFKNRIGLADARGEFLASSGDVVLSFPYKDCVLEGGQTKEDQKRSEVFYNRTLAPDEIDRLLDPKALCHAVRHDKDGAHPATSFDPAADNLVLKGNNLLALASLLPRYEGKVKLIYIDPPYYFSKQKESDSFSYNPNFKLSTWLVFMRDRLQLAWRLLSNGGVIFCHINEDGMHWLKVLMEESFNKDNFVQTFIWKNTDNPDSLSNKSRSSVEYLICFEKNKDPSKNYIGKQSENGDAPLLNAGNAEHELRFPAGTIRFSIPDGAVEESKPNRVRIATPFEIINGRNDRDIVLSGEFRWGQHMLDEEIKKGTYFLVKSKEFSIRFQRLTASTMAPEKFIDSQYLSKTIGVGTNEDASSHLQDMEIDFSYSKPESLAAFLIRATTEPNELVLDFFVGSGTTVAVAHKMGRRYIGIEQLNYIETKTIPRLEKVIGGERGGISDAVGWKGGGSFVSCELAKCNAVFAEEIAKAADDAALTALLWKILDTGYASHRVWTKGVKEYEADFAALPTDEKRKVLFDLLDANMLYVNRSDADDAESGLSDADKAFTRSFYGE